MSRSEDESNAVRNRGKRKQGADAADPVLPEKKRARRRLVGAVALVLAVVIGLPMVLDSEPKQAGDDITIQIPSRDKTNQTTPFSAPSGNSSASADKKDQALEAPVSTPDATSKSTVAAMPAASVNETPGKLAAPTPTAAAKPAVSEKPIADPKAAPAGAKPAPKSESLAKPVRAESPGVSQVAEKSAEAERATAILEAQPVAAKPDPKLAVSESKPATEQKSGKYVVQVAALATQEKVNELRAQLKAAGIETYTTKVTVEGGERTRVRTGPFASKEEAEKMRVRLIKLGLKGTLVPGSR